MMPTAFGVIQPAEILVVGVGVAGLQAIATAKRLGQVKALISVRKPMNRPKSWRDGGALDVPPARPGKGGYAIRLPEEWYKEREALLPAVKNADILILTALIPEEAPLLIDEHMVKQMKPGAVIVDIAVDQGEIAP